MKGTDLVSLAHFIIVCRDCFIFVCPVKQAASIAAWLQLMGVYLILLHKNHLSRWWLGGHYRDTSI